MKEISQICKYIFEKKVDHNICKRQNHDHGFVHKLLHFDSDDNAGF